MCDYQTQTGDCTVDYKLKIIEGVSAIKELPQQLNSLSNLHEGHKRQRMSKIRLLESLGKKE